MKKMLISSLVLLALTLTACGAGTTPAGPGSGEATLTAETRLIVGTFKLEDTDYAVTPEQASQLLILWQVYRELAQGDIAAQEEIDGLLAQIEDTMTDEQMQAIDGMGLSQQDVFALMQERGLAMGGGQGLSAEQMATAQASRSSGGGGFTPPEGGFPAGDIPGGGGGFESGQGPSPDQIATAQASRGAGGTGPTRVPSALIEALIQLLQQRAGA